MCSINHAVTRHVHQHVTQLTLQSQINLRRLTAQVTLEASPLGAVQLIASGTQQVDSLTVMLRSPTRRGAAGDVIHNAHHRHHGGRVNSLATGLVVQGHVTAGHRNTQLHAAISQAANSLSELPHDVRVLGRTEVQAVRHSHGACTNGRNVTVRLSQGRASTLVRIQVGETRGGVGRQSNTEVGVLVHAHNAAVVRHGQGGVALNVAVVLVGDPGLGAHVRGRHERLDCLAQLLTARAGIVGSRTGEVVSLDVILPLGACVRTLVGRAVVRNGAGVNIHDDLAVPLDDQAARVGDLTEEGVLHAPLVHDRFEALHVLGGDNSHHAFLRLRHQNLARGQGGVTQQNLGQVDVHAALTVRSQLAGCAGNTRSTQVLNTLNHGALEQLQAALNQNLLSEGVAHLNGRTLRRLGVIERLGRQHRRTADTVATGACTEQNNLVAHARCVRQADVLVTHNTHSQCVDQRVCLVAGIELNLAADVRQAQGVTVTTNTGNHAANNAGGVRVINRAETQRIHHSNRACTHGNNVTHNTAHTGRSTLVGLHVRGVVVGLNLEGNSPAVTNIGHTGVLTDTDHQVLLHLIGDLCTELLQMNLRRLVGAVLGPHDRVHCQLSRGRTATKNLLNVLELVLLQAQLSPGEFGVRGCRRVLDGVEVKLLFAHNFLESLSCVSGR